jgi:uncharacterized low-complexity protein
MKTDKKILISASIVAGALMTTSLAAAPSPGPDILAYNDLGSGAEVRSHLIDVNSNQVSGGETVAYKFAEMKCGEDSGKEGEAKKGDDKAATTAESKDGEAKCGEGKCGEGKCGGDDKKAESATTEKKSAEAKDSEAKCGEGKCA